MPKYFANKNQFTPATSERDLPALDSITGILITHNVRSGNSASGLWLVFRVKMDDEFYDVYFDTLYIGDAGLAQYDTFHKRVVTIRSVNETPVIGPASLESGESLRVTLVKGVAAGNIKMDDLPALLAFVSGDDDLFEQWKLFKKKLDNNGLEKEREEIEQTTAAEKKLIEQLKTENAKLVGIQEEITQKQDEMLKDIDAALVLLQGEELLLGKSYARAPNPGIENLVCISDGYGSLMGAIEKCKTKKGVFVICGDSIHKIHSAYFDRGRAYLLGSSTPFKGGRQEDTRALVEKINETVYPNLVSPNKESL